jgi:hypothetical protein
MVMGNVQVHTTKRSFSSHCIEVIIRTPLRQLPLLFVPIVIVATKTKPTTDLRRQKSERHKPEDDSEDFEAENGPVVV